MSAPIESKRRIPSWIRTRIPSGEGYRKTREVVAQSGVATVCEEAHCPNLAECWAHGTATFWDPPTARNSNLLPVNANGDVRSGRRTRRRVPRPRNRLGLSIRDVWCLRYTIMIQG